MPRVGALSTAHSVRLLELGRARDLEPELPEELAFLGEPEPHAAMRVLARIDGCGRGKPDEAFGMWRTACSVIGYTAGDAS